MRLWLLNLTLASGVVSGCGHPHPGLDVAYSRATAEARRTQVAGCSSSPTAAITPECLAVLKAAGEVESQRALSYQPPAGRLNNTGHL